LLVTLMLAVRAPAAAGVNVTAKLQLPPGATAAQVLPDTANSAGALLVMLATVTAALLALVMVTVDGALGVPTSSVPKVTVPGTVSVPVTGPLVPFPIAVNTFGLPAAELENVMLELRKPIDEGENVTLIAQVPPAGIVPQVVLAAKSLPLLAPPVVVMSLVLLLVTLIDIGALVPPTGVAGKLSDDGENASWEMPVPATLMATLPALLPTVTVPARAPLPAGLKAMATVHVAPLARLAPAQVFDVRSKSGVLLLLTVRPLRAPP